MTEIQIRLAMSSEYNQLATLDRIVYGQSAWTAANFRKAVDEQHAHVVVALLKGTIVGQLTFAGDDPEIIPILDIAVHPDHRRRGMAENMIRYLFDLCDRSLANSLTHRIGMVIRLPDCDAGQRLLWKMGFLDYPETDDDGQETGDTVMDVIREPSFIRERTRA